MTTPTATYVEKPHSYMSYGWEKCKKQPLVPIGMLATTAALIGASFSLRSGNRSQFNKYLRARVVFQGVTVVAMVAGALMLTNKSDNVKASRERVLRGELPPDSNSPEAHTTLINPFSSSSSPSSSPSSGFSSPSPNDAKAEVGGAYPPKERVKVSDFARRLREAEGMQKEEDDARARRR